MPLYIYKCSNCARSFEVLAKTATEKPPEEGCCWCGSDDVTRQPAAPAVRFKGNGFHCNDYPSKKS